MATNKTLAPTGVTVQIPAMTDPPSMAVPANAIDKTIDAVNALNSNIEALATNGSTTEVQAISTSGQNVSYTIPTTGLYAVKGSTGNTAGDLAVYMFTSSNAQITNMSVKNMGTYGQVFTSPIPLKAGTTIKAQFIGPSGASGAIVKYGN